MSAQYRHRPLLSSRSIRLLQCRERHDDATDLSGYDFGLYEAGLDEDVPFYALSYVWGETKPTESIICNNENMSITTNCKAALQHILPRTKSCNIWIDSVCINQTCTLEKPQQISLMGEIFSSADKVLIWLGHSNDKSHRMFQLLHGMAHDADLPVGFSPDDSVRRMEVLSGSAVFGMYPKYDQEIFDVFCRPYFDRIWTFQEAVLARRAEVICGADWMPWDHCLKASYVLHQKYSSTGFSMYSAQITGRMQQIRILRERLGLDAPPTAISFAIPHWHPLSPTNGFPVSSDKRMSRFGIGATLYQTTTLLSTEQRDKVYGLYAIYQKLGIQLPSPNYARPFYDLVVETSEALLRQNPSFELLYYVGGNHKAPELPSWVHNPNSFYTPWIPCHEFYDASRSTKPRFILHPNHELTIYGIFVDDISLRSSHWEYDRGKPYAYHWWKSEQFQQVFGPMISSMQEILYHASEVPTKEGSQNPFARLCEVLLQEIYLSYQDTISGLQKIYELFGTWAEKVLIGEFSTPKDPEIITALDARYRLTTERWKSVDEYFSILNEQPSLRALFYTPSLQIAEEIKSSSEWKTLTAIDDDKGAAMVHEIVVCRWMNNCLFTTKSGRMGLASSALEAGDQVVLFSGFLLPMIVRQEGSRHRLISAAYVEGLMFGEEWPDDQAKLREFTIR